MLHAHPGIDEDEIARFNDSLDACTAGPAFLDDFYDRFIGSSPAVAAKFASTDMAHQKRALKASLYISMLAADRNAPAVEHLSRLHETHVEQEIGHDLYDHWERCLLASAAAYAPDWDERTDLAWRKVLAVAIYVMKSGHVEPFLRPDAGG